MNRTACVWMAIVLAAGMAAAQTKTTMTGKCPKSDVQQSVPAGDQPGHMFMVAEGKCSVTGSINGAMAKSGSYSEHVDTNGMQMKNWGVYTVTFDSGDKVFYNYQTTGTMKDGAFQTGANKYQITGGTGKMKGIKGSGACKLTGNADGTLDYTCNSEYTMGGAAPAKP